MSQRENQLQGLKLEDQLEANMFFTQGYYDGSLYPMQSVCQCAVMNAEHSGVPMKDIIERGRNSVFILGSHVHVIQYKV